MFLNSRSLAFSAFRAGSLHSFVVRPSLNSATGIVAVCTFSCPVRAASFARRWAIRLGLPVAIRHRVTVSIPVVVAGSRPFFLGRVVSPAGGLRGFTRSLAAMGVVRGC